MRIGDIDIYHLPAWLEGIFEEVERTCYEKLEEESEFYRKVLEETKALSRFWLLETDRMSMERVQMYLLGCRHMWEAMELLNLRE